MTGLIVGVGAINRPLRISCVVPMMLHVNHIKHSIAAWESRVLRVRTTISGLDNPYIPFAILKHDPLPPFLRAQNGKPAGAIEPAPSKLDCAATLSVCELWQQAFAALNEEQRFFLYAWSANGKATPRMVEAAALIVGIATPGPHYKRWLTTGALIWHGEIVAWRAEIAMQLEQRCMTEIVLSEENMLRLESYASI